jgi:hypothetical protein
MYASWLVAVRSLFLRCKPCRAYVGLSLAFIAARAALYAAGLRMNFALEWMWLADPRDLRERLWHTLLYFHAMPPGMNLLAAFCLRVGGVRAASVALLLFETFGLLLANALFALGRALRLRPSVAMALALGFSLTPAAIYFDHLYIYESPVAALLTFSIFLAWRALCAPSFGRWLAFFTCCALIGLTRTTFHLVWLLALTVVTALLSGRRLRRTVVSAALAPLLLLGALYTKNYVLFGFFDAFSEGPVSLNLVTTRHLSDADLDAWIADGKLSPYAAVDVFAGPRAYLPFFASPNNPAYPPELSRLELPTHGAPNYNHWFYLEVMPVRRRDAFVYLRERPVAYLHTVARGVTQFFSPTTLWHPRERSGYSPHAQVRSIIGGYETLYNRVFHTFPVAPVGLYVLVPAVLLWSFERGRALRRASDDESRARAALLWLILFQISYVVAVSVLFTFQEESRYRFQIEPLLWLLAATALTAFVDRLRRPPRNHALPSPKTNSRA